MSLKKYSVECRCGRTLPVEATQAGTMLVCTGCSQSVSVPRMSVLRVSAGEAAIPLNAAERVQRAVAEGNFPNNPICPITGNSADCTAHFVIACERAWRQEDQSGTVQMIVFHLIFGWLGVLFSLLQAKGKGGDGEPKIHGRETLVNAPLRVSHAALPQLSGIWTQSGLRSLLSNVPQYAELFQEYPAAEIVFVPAPKQS